jgi:putative sodium/glutamine symporter
LLSKVAFAALKDYLGQKKAGKDPVFYQDSISGLDNIEAWDHSKDKSSSKKAI